MFASRFNDEYAKELADFDEFVKTRVAKKICWRYDIHSVYLTHEGHVYTRGLNSDGQLGLGDKQNRYRKDGHIMPVRILNLENIIDIYAGCHETFCIDKDFKVFAWGCNRSGQLGLGNNEDTVSPCLVEALVDHKIVAVETNACVTYFLDDQGNVYSCGYFN